MVMKYGAPPSGMKVAKKKPAPKPAIGPKPMTAPAKKMGKPPIALRRKRLAKAAKKIGAGARTFLKNRAAKRKAGGLY